MSVLSNWKEVLDTANLSPDKKMDVVSKWLIITRAAVFSMTATSGLIGGLLAVALAERPHYGNFALALVGLILAHADRRADPALLRVDGRMVDAGLCPRGFVHQRLLCRAPDSA